MNLGVCSFLQQSACSGFPCENGSYIKTVPGESSCTVTVEEPDHVNVRCEDIVTQVPNKPPLFERGDVEIDATCRLVYRN